MANTDHLVPRWSTKKKDNAPRGVYRHPSGVWAVRFTCGAGCIHKERVGPSKELGIKVYHKRKARAQDEPGWCPKVEKRQARHVVASALTVRTYGARWLVSRQSTLKPRTWDGYRYVLEGHLFPSLGDIQLPELSRAQLRQWLGSKKELSRATQANLVIPVRAMLNEALDDGLIASNPATRLLRAVRGLTERDARTVEALTREELTVVLQAADTRYPEWAEFFKVLSWCGLRLGEACGLQWQDLDVTGGFLEIRRNVAYRQRQVLIGAPKSGQARRVDVPRVLVERLQARQGIQETEAVFAGVIPPSWIFPAPTNTTKPVNPAFVRYKVWYRLLRLAALRSLRLHSLRHTYASLLLQDGESPAYVKVQLGHSSIQLTVDRYGHFVPGGNRQAVDRLAERTSKVICNYPATSPMSRTEAER